MSEMTGLLEKLKREIKEGGELKESLCPLCRKPRSQRSDYQRCSSCGMNWIAGEDLSKNPLLSREPYISRKKMANSDM